ncbi:S49 family peptidase [Myxococcota bacterium]|nr:S49 family peptidase [Myxococcota bacterium]MBU1410920.1 S49 family peptidase [Myxococcota bacterium]MBU1509437.1 S49 family peptidase [Myxococcota bacterium]
MLNSTFSRTLLVVIAWLSLAAPGCSKPPAAPPAPANPPASSAPADMTDKATPPDGANAPVQATTPATPDDKPGLPRCMHLVWSGSLLDVKNESPFVPRQVQLPSLLKQLRDYATDDTVKALLIEMQAFNGGLSSFWELRTALQEFRAKGKKIHFYADAYDTRAYYLASIADDIVLHPAGAWEVAGIAAEFTFLKDALALVGVSADFLQVGKFKGAAENLTRNSMSEELKLSLNAMLDSLYDNLLEPIAKSRSLQRDQLVSLVDQGILDPPAALVAKVIDHVENFSALHTRLAVTYHVEKAAKAAKTKPNLFELLSPQATESEPDYPHIALLQAQGPILYSAGDPTSLLGEDAQIAALEFMKTLEKIKKNPNVKGIILRINSPGGSALASDILWLGLREAAGERPMVASMGATAASGGYYMASAASTIFASPFTLTGSIGVVGGKLVFKDTMTRLKVGTELLSRGRNSGYMATSRPFSPTEREMISKSMERTYQLFLDRVRTTRPQVKNLEELAQGRIWSGAQAKSNGLVDRLGGLQDAATEVRRLASLPPETPVLIYPRPKPWLQQISEMFDPDARMDLALSRFVRTRLPFGQAVLNALGSTGVLQHERAAVLLPFYVEGL